jgi:hypothetical protein
MTLTMIDRRVLCLLLPLLMLLALGCAQESPPSDSGEAAESSPSADSTDGEAPAVEPLPEGIAPNSGGAPAGGNVALGEPIQGPGITFQLPAGWQFREPTKSMRMGEAVIPGPDGADGADGELTIFYFGAGAGGGVEANLQRWAGQMELNAQPERQILSPHASLKVTWIDCVGTLKASTMGTGPTTDQAGSRLFGAVVEGPGGPWFFKATGPDATLAAERDGFLALLNSLKPNSTTA